MGRERSMLGGGGEKGIMEVEMCCLMSICGGEVSEWEL